MSKTKERLLLSTLSIILVIAITVLHVWKPISSHIASPPMKLKSATALSAKCAEGCSPCSGSQEYSSLTCINITDTVPKMRPHFEYTQKVILSSDIENFFYAWFAPITTLIWSEVMKWKPVSIFVYITDIGPVFNYIIRHIEVAGAEVIKLRNTLPEPYYLRNMVVTTSRFTVGSRYWPDDPYLLISDDDMWPMSAEKFNEQTFFPASVHILWAKNDVPGKSEIPACYIGMKLSTWREIMHIKKGDDMIQTVAGLRNSMSNDSFDKSSQWGIDQGSFTKKLYHWKGFPNMVHFYGRDRLKDRLHRSVGPIICVASWSSRLTSSPPWFHLSTLEAFSSDIWLLIFSMKSNCCEMHSVRARRCRLHH